MNLIKFFLKLPRRNKQFVIIIVDLLSLYLSIYLSFLVRFNSLYPLEYIFDLKYRFIYLVPIITIPLFVVTGLYRAVLKHIGYRTLLAAFNSISISTMLLIVFVSFYSLELFPLDGLLLMNWFISIFITFFIRYCAHGILYPSIKNKDLLSVIIYGAGEAGVMLAETIQQGNKYRIICFIDDDENIKVGTVIKSIRVFSSNRIGSLIETYNIDMILLAIPSIGKRLRKNILNKISLFPVKVMELPSIENIIDGNVTIDDIKPVEAIDILGRSPVKPFKNILGKNIKDKNILVTGGGGSIGSELCRQILNLKPSKIIIYEISEFNLYSIHHELLELNKTIKIIPILGNVQHRSKIRDTYIKYSIDTVYHAAAYKHVPMVESNPCAGAYNNIVGTYITAYEAKKCNVKNFIFISTDKAVRSTNIMGATKRFSELILKMLHDNKNNSTIFTMVRFGNVLDSAGSVLPLFRKQIRSGGPVTVTDRNVVRYFMSIPEAVQLVIQAGTMAKGGEVFLLDMGEPINIFEMATKMIYLSGLTPISDDNKNGDIKIEITGLRPGEKLYEELLIGDSSDSTVHPRIMKANEIGVSEKIIKKGLDEIIKSCKLQDGDRVKELLKKYVDGYNPS